MKIGVYISGLGQSVVNESIEKYAERLKNEIDFSTVGIEYEIKKEKVNYSPERETTVVSICEKNEQGKVLYKMYDFKYNAILTERFNSSSIIVKNFWLFLLIISQFPQVVKRLVVRTSYNRPLQTLYIFCVFLIVACAVLSMLPATLSVMGNFFDDQKVIELKDRLGIHDIPFVSKSYIEGLSKTIVSITAVLLLIVPNANALISNLATEFVCANDYLQHGSQRQLINGNLELLVNYITEHEKDCKIHFHAYSFGSVVAIDYIYPYGNNVSRNAELFCEALVTIGTPYEFIKSYYPHFYLDRKVELGDKIQWLNVYSIADALASNFKRELEIGDSEFGIVKAANKPININYEVAPIGKGGIWDFFLLYSIRVHGMYWDNNTEGGSCLGLIYGEMNKRSLI